MESNIAFSSFAIFAMIYFIGSALCYSYIYGSSRTVRSFSSYEEKCICFERLVQCYNVNEILITNYRANYET